MGAPKRVALVTGANRGIGFAIAQGLVQRGVMVRAAARRREDAEDAARALGSGAIGIELELSDAVGAEARARCLLEELGPIDILVNNAAVMKSGQGIEVDTAAFVESLTVNAASPFALIRVFGPPMRQAGWGRIVNVSSGWGSFEEGMSGPTAYSVSKAALNAITLAWVPLLGRSVKINAACPGWVRTRMGGQAALRSPEEGADTPLWLATLPDDGPTGGFFRDRKLIEW